jgi:hypothetical protein
MKKSVLIAVCGLTAAAQAGVVSQSQSFSGVPNYDEVFTFDMFDTGLGTLTGVDVSLQLDIFDGFLGVDNDGIGPATVEVEFGASGALTSGDVTLFPGPAVVTSNNGLFNLAADDGDGVGVQSTGADYDQLSGVFTSNTSTESINAAFISEYEGTGLTFDILASVIQVLDFGGVSGVAGEFGPQSADIYIDVVYYYDPVPAPGTAALLGLGGLIATRRRR